MYFKYVAIFFLLVPVILRGQAFYKTFPACTWNRASQIIDSLNSTGGRWRMPSVKEMQAIYEKPNGSIDPGTYHTSDYLVNALPPDFDTLRTTVRMYGRFAALAQQYSQGKKRDYWQLLAVKD